MKSFDQMESPVVDRTVNKKRLIQSAKLSRFWAVLNLLLAFIFCIEVMYQTIAHYLDYYHPVFWYSACVLAIVFTVNTLVDLKMYLSPAIYSATVELTPRQMRLLGVRLSDIGFKSASPKVPTSVESTNTSLIFSPSIFSSPSSHSLHGSPTSSPSPGHSPVSHRISPGHISPSSPSFNQSRNIISPSNMNQSGFLNQSGYRNQAMDSLHDHQYSYRSQTNSPITPNLSPLFRENDQSGLRSRHLNISTKSSLTTTEDCMSDLDSLNQYLREQEDKSFKQQMGNTEVSPGAGASFWSFNRTTADYTPVLRKYQYQIACRSPQTTKFHHDDDIGDFSSNRADEMWAKLGVNRGEVDKWTENLRKWIGRSIMSRLVEEINKVNADLNRIGCEDLTIGEVSIATLKQVAVTKGQHVPTLNVVISFLEVTSNQEYLVQRIKELGTDGCMSDFRWSKGGNFKDKPWGEHLPSDSTIVMHSLCTYMDLRLPSHPKYPDGKTFTSQHFIKTPDKPNLSKPDNLLIYQTKINPPHYKVVIGDHTWDLPKGRNNMFHAMILFLYHIKTKENGMLGRVNLGLSGINILWILENKS